MTRKTRNLLISISLLAVLIGILVITKFVGNPESAEAPKATPDSVVLSDISPDDVRSVKVDRAEGELHLYSSDGETWLVADTPAEFRPAVDRIQAAVRSLSSIRSRDIITEDAGPDDLGTYGLENPAGIMTLRDREGGSAVIEFGNANPSETGRYARIAGAGTVVIVPSYVADQAFKSPDDFRDMSLPSVKVDSLTVISFQKDGRMFRAEPRQGDDPFVTVISSMEITSPWRGRYPLDDYELQKIMTERTPPPTTVRTWEDGLDPEDASLGLTPEDEADFLYLEDSEGNVLHIIVGSRDGKGGRYCRLGGEDNAVFTLTESDLAILDTDPFELTGRFVFLGSITAVSQVKVERGSESWIMRREDRGEPNDTKDDRFIVNGLETAHKEFTSVYQKFIAIMWEGVAQKNVELGPPEIRITVSHVDDGVDPVTIRFWPYDDVYYIAGVGNQPLEFLVGRYQVEDFIEDLAALSEFAS